MSDPRSTDPNRRSGPADKRPRSSGRGLILSIVIIVLVLVGFLFWNNSGFQPPPDEAVAPEGESPQTAAPSGIEPSPPEVPEEVPETAPQQ